MKKIVALVLIAVIGCIAAFAENNVENNVMAGGTVIGFNDDGGYIIENAEHGMIEVAVNEETYAETMRDIAAGDYIFVEYDGQMTRSIPPQVNAVSVRMYVLEGDIVEHSAEEDAVTLMTETHGEVYVTLPEEWKDTEIDFEYMTVYFDGVMTMSLPPRMNGAYVVPGYSMQGVVSEIGDGYIVIGENMEAVQVNTADVELPGDMKTGDIVRVIYDGQMTRSIPAQVNAQDIVQISR